MADLDFVLLSDSVFCFSYVGCSRC